MALRTAEEFKASLRDGRCVYAVGERVADVTTHPMLQIVVEHAANTYRLAADSRFDGLFTFTPPDTGEKVSRYFMQPRDAQQLQQRGDLIEEHTRQGKSTLDLTKAVGTDALLALTIVSEEIDRAIGSAYAPRVGAFLRHCRDRDLSMALAQTDVKGDRSLRPHEQADPDLYVRIVERRSDGIVVRGAKAHTTMAPAVNELIVIPSRAMEEADQAYAVAFAVPVAVPGLKLICRPTPTVDQSPFDFPVSRTNIETETLTVFDDVFVPWDRVFLSGEWQFAGAVATGFAMFHRVTAVSYKPPIADLFVGAAQLAAEYHGIANVSHIREKIARLIQYAELIRACRKTAAWECRTSRNGLAVPNPVYTNAGKYHFASQFHEATRLLQDIAGGLVITMPTEKDYRNPETRPYIEKYLAGRVGVPTEHKLRLFNLIKDLTASDFGGYNDVVTLHGEGSLAAQIITMTREYDLERCKQLACQAAGIEPVVEPAGDGG